MKERLKEIFSAFEVKEIELGDYKKVKAGPISFTIEAYDVEGFGRVSILKGKAMMGLMKMDTWMITPFYHDSPLFSYDRIKAMGNDTFILEMYDTFKEKHSYPELLSIKDQHRDFSHYQMKPNWYDPLRLEESISIKEKRKGKELDSLFEEYLKTFVRLVSLDTPMEEKEKKALHKKYVDGLLSRGGPSTDVFVKALGKEKTTDLFENYLFGVN